MRSILVAVAVLLCPLAQEGSLAAQSDGPTPTGTAEAGKALWAVGNTSCRNCHGPEGQGAFAPPLAGRKLTYERFRDYVREPIGRMPAYLPSELTDQEVADLVAYFESLPLPAEPAPWRTPLPDDAPRGQRLAVSQVGCGQCHGATLETPRHGAAEVRGDWEWFSHMVYEHTVAQREQWNLLDPNLPRSTPSPAGPPGRNRVRMGNYSRTSLPEATLKEIFDWMIDLGYLPPFVGVINAGEVGSSGASYTVTVTNAGVKGKGVTVEEVTVEVALPAGASVVSAAGTGYQGVHNSEEAKAMVATWRVPRMAAADQETFTLTLSSATSTLGGTIRWARPMVKADDDVTFGLRAGRGGR